jgi:wyosine [tRNA(Phe)-imidazoG37] synthetase (radical SAM superfamily)
LIPLQTGIVYGPVRSKRLGRSLGVNLFPADKKVCSFDCVYCHFGRTTDHTRSGQGFAVPAVSAVLAAVEAQLRTQVGFDFITLSGNGEPTMYPEFAALVSGLKVLRNRIRPAVRLALLSNSSTVTDRTLWPALLDIDLPVFKLDAGDQQTFEALNHPCPELKVSEIIDALVELSSRVGIWIQSAIVSAPVSNHQGPAFVSWLNAVRRIRPRQIQLYTTDRPVPDTRVMKLTDAELDAVAEQVRVLTGIAATAYY